MDVTTVFDTAFTRPARVPAGFYPDGLLSDGDRQLTAIDMTGTVHIGGLTITDPVALAAFAGHLTVLAARLADRAPAA